MKHWKYITCAASACLAIALSSCDAINDDLSDCGKDVELTYRMQLITNMHHEIDSVLGEPQDKPVADALRQTMSLYFNDQGHDLDLSFYDRTEGTRTDQHAADMNGATQASYTIYLQQADYRHTAVANLRQNGIASWAGAETMAKAMLANTTADTIGPHQTGIFTGRHTFSVTNSDQKLSGLVDLYMANDAAAVVIDTTGVQVKGITAYLEGLANAFSTADSIYHYDRRQTIRTERLAVSQGSEVCYYGMGFPSPETPTRADEAPYYWRMLVYVTMVDGTVTENVLTIGKPLRAGQLKIIKLRLKEDGEVTSVDAEVGVSVTLDWKEGPHFEK